MANTEKDALLENYDELRQSRGWSWDQMADNLDSQDPRLAAALRKQAGTPANKAPKKRAASRKRTAAPTEPKQDADAGTAGGDPKDGGSDPDDAGDGGQD